MCKYLIAFVWNDCHASSILNLAPFVRLGLKSEHAIKDTKRNAKSSHTNIPRIVIQSQRKIWKSGGTISNKRPFDRIWFASNSAKIWGGCANVPHDPLFPPAPSLQWTNFAKDNQISELTIWAGHDVIITVRSIIYWSTGLEHNQTLILAWFFLLANDQALNIH